MPVPPTYRATIWYMWKPGDERTFAMTIPPAREWAAIQKAAGYNIVSFEIELPDVAQMQLAAVDLTRQKL